MVRPPKLLQWNRAEHHTQRCNVFRPSSNYFRYYSTTNGLDNVLMHEPVWIIPGFKHISRFCLLFERKYQGIIIFCSKQIEIRP